ncbi:MAG TPA: pantoate--beta-alanine ligase [Blastocatellia bacterium]|jgi:pantoate--beta-alanine ligase
MEIINRIPRMTSIARELRSSGKRTGLVPTSGGLHEGHLSLATRARELCDAVTLSILAPRADESAVEVDLPRDAELASTRGLDYLFAPSYEEMFPEGFSTTVIVRGLSEKLEGAGQPGYLDDIATATTRLLNIVRPHFVFFGMKHPQRVLIAKQLIKDLSMDTELVACPTVREEDGLALSSSNVLLNTQERKAATALRRALDRCQSAYNEGERDSARLIDAMRSVIEAEPLAHVDYIAITDIERLDSVAAVPASDPTLVSLAVYVGATRLTDSIVFNDGL